MLNTDTPQPTFFFGRGTVKYEKAHHAAQSREREKNRSKKGLHHVTSHEDVRVSVGLNNRIDPLLRSAPLRSSLPSSPPKPGVRLAAWFVD